MVAGLMVACLASAAVASAAPATSELAGTVSRMDGARLPRATVTVTERECGQQLVSVSDELGSFLLHDIPDGTYDLVAEFPGLTPRVVTGLVIEADSPTARVDVVFETVRITQSVEVTAPAPRDSVEVTEVRESPARDVGELLEDSAGIWKLRKGGIASDVVLRGLQSRDLNVLVDGQRVYGACPNHMDPPAFHVDFSEVERIDVDKGPFDVRHQGSLGGVVNVRTRRAEAGWQVSPTIGFGSFGFVNPSATVSHGGERVSVLGGMSFRRSDPYRDGNGQLFTHGVGYRTDALESDAFRAGTAWGRASWNLAPGRELEVSYTRQETDHTLYPYLLMDAVYDNTDRLNVQYEAFPWTAQVYWSRVDHWMTNEYRQSSLVAPREYSMGTDASTFTMGGRLETTLRGVAMGGEAFRRNWNAETLMAPRGYAPQYSIPDVNIDSVGLFAERSFVLDARTVLEVGGRLDHVRSSADATKANTMLYRAYHDTTTTSRDDLLPSGRMEIARQLSETIDVKASVGHTARVAEGNERFFGLRRRGTDWVGNPDLAPARNTGIDVAVSMTRARLSLAANGFVNAIHDYVAVHAAEQLMLPGNVTARTYANVDARLRGFEVTGSAALRPLVSVSGDVSYVRGTMTPIVALGITSTNLAETPPLRSRMRLRFDDSQVFVEIEGVASAAQTKVDTTLGEQPTSAYFIANLTGGFRRGSLALTVGIANLLDRYYVEHLSYQRDPYRAGLRVAEPGRNMFTNLSWKF